MLSCCLREWQPDRPVGHLVVLTLHHERPRVGPDDGIEDAAEGGCRAVATLHTSRSLSRPSSGRGAARRLPDPCHRARRLPQARLGLPCHFERDRLRVGRSRSSRSHRANLNAPRPCRAAIEAPMTLAPRRVQHRFDKLAIALSEWARITFRLVVHHRRMPARAGRGQRRTDLPGGQPHRAPALPTR